jgi:hypothetical protein
MNTTIRLKKKEFKIVSEHLSWKTTMPFTIFGNISIPKLSEEEELIN